MTTKPVYKIKYLHKNLFGTIIENVPVRMGTVKTKIYA